MKKLLLFASTLMLLIICFTVNAYADNRVSSIDIDASLNKDCSAVITQVWKGSFNEGTECYYPFNTKGELEITDFTVSDENGAFETLDSWDIDASFSEKARKCGLNYTDYGYEVCWGISQYSNNTYTVKYTVKNLVGSFDEEDGFNFRFVNDEMNTGPTAVTVTISMADGTPLTDSNSDIWAFGFDGDIQFLNNGTIYAKTSSDVDSDNHVTIMCGFEKGIFSSLESRNKSFEDFKETAFDGSDYETDEDSVFVSIIAATMVLVIAIIFGTLIISAIARKKRFKRFEKECGYFRDTPNNGELNVSYNLALAFKQCSEGDIIGARILQMISRGNIEGVKEETTGAFGRVRETVSLRLVKPPEDENSFNRRLYNILSSAAGSDGILQEKELSKYSENHYKRLRTYLDDCDTNGESILINRDCYSKVSIPLTNYGYEDLRSLSENGKNELAELIGFKKYLLDFSLISEKEINESVLWQDCLVYAVLLGIADKVANQLKEVYPQYIEDIDNYVYHINYIHLYCIGMMNSIRSQEAEARSSGSGGSASFGGGGGFSGGGSGGGTR